MQAKFERRKIVRTQTLGEVLRRTRLERGYQLQEVSKRTMIPAEYIEYLEKGKYESLPAKVYVEGYVRKVADALNLNESAIVKIYKREVGIQENLDKEHKKHEKTSRFHNQRFVVHPTLLRNAMIVLLIMGAIGYLWFQVSSLSKAPEIALIQPAADGHVSQDELLVLGSVTKGAQVHINGQSVYVNDAGDFKENLTLETGANSIQIQAQNRLGKTTTITRQIYADVPKTTQIASTSGSGAATPISNTGSQSATNSTPAGTPMVLGANTTTNTPVASKPSGVNVAVAISDTATWVQVAVDGKTSFSGTMLPGSSKNFTGTDNVTVTSGKANKTLITFNGKNIGALDSSGGVVRDVKFDKNTSL